jgi:ARP2/3 complex ARPC3 (21 kDa) subunit
LFRNFEIKGPADRTLIILILFISDCLAKLGSARTVPTQIEATKLLNTLSVDTFPIPGDANFPLNSHYASPPSRSEAGKLLPFAFSTPTSIHPIFRLSPPISDTSSSGTLSTAGREVIRRWDRQAQQMVDVIPEKTLHEQKFRDMKEYFVDNSIVNIIMNTCNCGCAFIFFASFRWGFSAHGQFEACLHPSWSSLLYGPSHLNQRL